MKGLIIAGGLATRLRPLTESTPKQLLPIANRPMLEHQIALLASHGVRDVTLLTGFLAEAFDDFVASMAPYEVRIRVSTEAEPLGTAGAVRSRLDDLDGTTIVLNGDVITGIDIAALVAQHREHGAIVTIALTYVPDSSSFGVVPLDDDGRVQAFIQNPKSAEPMPGDWINAGIYALEPRALADIPPDVMWSFEEQVFPPLVAAGEPVYGFRSEAYWLDIGNRERYLRAHADVLDGSAPQLLDGRVVHDDAQEGAGAVRGPSLIADPVVVGRDAIVGPHATLGPGCSVGVGARIERSVLHRGVVVGARAVIRDCILGPGARIGEGRSLEGQILA